MNKIIISETTKNLKSKKNSCLLKIFNLEKIINKVTKQVKIFKLTLIPTSKKNSNLKLSKENKVLIKTIVIKNTNPIISKILPQQKKNKTHPIIKKY